MENILDKLKEILEVDSVDPKSKFDEFEEWDSLTVLTLISLVDSDYGITMNKEQLEGFENIEAFCSYIKSNAR